MTTLGAGATQYGRPRDFVGYGPGGPDVTWPDGRRMALNIVVNYEEGAELNLFDGDESVEPSTEGSYSSLPGERQITNESVYEYGARVGVWRILRILREYGVPYSVFACGRALERNAVLCRELSADRADIVGHGYRWVSLYGKAPEEQLSEIRRAQAAVAEATGVRIEGWLTRAPQSVVTRRLLAHEGFLYDTGEFNDDVPYFEDVEGRPFLIVPYTLAANDYLFWQRAVVTASEFAEYCIDEFETLFEESTRFTRLMSLGLHPRIIGRPGRIGALRRFLEHVMTRPDVWLASRSQVAHRWSGASEVPGQWNFPRAGAEGQAGPIRIYGERL